MKIEGVVMDKIDEILEVYASVVKNGVCSMNCLKNDTRNKLTDWLENRLYDEMEFEEEDVHEKFGVVTEKDIRKIISELRGKENDEK
jgi:hypothetical protein